MVAAAILLMRPWLGGFVRSSISKPCRLSTPERAPAGWGCPFITHGLKRHLLKTKCPGLAIKLGARVSKEGSAPVLLDFFAPHLALGRPKCLKSEHASQFLRTPHDATHHSNAKSLFYITLSIDRAIPGLPTRKNAPPRAPA